MFCGICRKNTGTYTTKTHNKRLETTYYRCSKCTAIKNITARMIKSNTVSVIEN